jgi:hypothetical protein
VESTDLEIMWTDEPEQILTTFSDTFGAGWSGQRSCGHGRDRLALGHAGSQQRPESGWQGAGAALVPVRLSFRLSVYLRSNTMATATAAGVPANTSTITRSNPRRDLDVTIS